jgi:hypothetical protein
MSGFVVHSLLGRRAGGLVAWRQILHLTLLYGLAI